MSVPHVDPHNLDQVVPRLREFFRSKGFEEAYTQNRLSILAACEQPETVATFNYAGEVWPLIQTNQMWLEFLLLQNPKAKGYYCLSTSYRNEPDPIPGRHDIIFPLFEFEARGNVDDMIALEQELLEYMGFSKDGDTFPRGTYGEVCKRYNSDKVDNEEERQLLRDFGSVYFLTDFTEDSSPFWNMRRDADGTSRKVDVIINGIETIGSAERSSDADDMRKRFHTISEGKYAQLLYNKFGKERVEKELEEFLCLPFEERYGGGIGVTRLIKGMIANGLVQ